MLNAADNTMERMLQMLNRRRPRAPFALTASIAVLAFASDAVQTSSAKAGQWMRTTCTNPDNSPAGSDGWSGMEGGGVLSGSTNKSTCGPGDPMGAFLSSAKEAPGGAYEALRYDPPDGSTLAGGTLFVGLSADGHGTRRAWEDGSATGSASIHTPDLTADPGNLVKVCIFPVDCQNGTSDYYGTVDLPADRGGSLYLVASCVGDVRSHCYQDGSHGAWSLVSVAWANLLLSTSSLPTAAGFRGNLLEPGAHGSAGLAFTANDNGPGVHRVVVKIDGAAMYDATPNTNAGKCVDHGMDPRTGALYFQWQQPCPRSQTVDLVIRTTTLADGPHELEVNVVNAARNSSTVLRQTITTNNRTTVSAGLTSAKPPAPTVAGPAPEYAVVLDAATQRLVRGVSRSWARSGLRLAGTLRNSVGIPAPGVPVTLFARYAGQAAPVRLARTTTNAAGRWALAARRGPSRRLTVAYGESPDPASRRAIRFRERVRAGLTLRIQALGHGRLRFSGKLSLKPLGSPRPLVAIQTRTRDGKHWQAVGSALRVGTAGSYSVTYAGGPDVIGGRFLFRAVANATSLFSTGISPVRKVLVL